MRLHATSASVYIDGDTRVMTEAQIRRAHKTLCAIGHCACAGDDAGARPAQVDMIL